MIAWLRQRVVGLGSVAGALIAITTAWGSFGFPTLASSADIKRLDRQQTETMIEVWQRAYQESVLALTDDKVRDNAVARTIVEGNIERARSKLEDARERLIELSK